ncbi:protein SLOW GREEN 1, chloroplastic [Apium graveolens]|uniref:protein SLOW GREEN 1, chloroplastic n=1 Tax=Apium graveolens TaxID=4045 RepID=UPI003D7BB770
METTLSKLTLSHHSLPLPFHPHRPSLSHPISPFSLKPHFSKSSIKISSSLSSFSTNLSTPIPKHKPLQVPSFNPFSLLKTSAIVTLTATAILFARFHVKPAVANPVSNTTLEEAAVKEEVVSDEEKEKTLEMFLNDHPSDVEALKNLMEIKIKNKKVQEATGIIDKLIVLEPEDKELPLLKSHIFCYSGDVESAKKGFNEILDKDPLRVEAYHGLVMAASQDESSPELEEVEKRIREGAELVKKENRMEEFRDFMLLLAQVQVFQGDFDDALVIYQDLVKEEPMDFRPYLCQSIIYSLMGKKNEAENSFRKYKTLVPEGHPYAQYFDDNLNATKLFSQKMENERKRASV